MTTPPSAFTPVFQSTKGIGGYESKDGNDHAFAFDGSSSGKRDHIFWYNCGSGKCSVLRKDQKGNFSAIYHTENGGVGGWDFGFLFDRAIAFDYNHSGRMDHVICYRPGAGGCYVLSHDGKGNFTPVYWQVASEKAGKDGGNGIGTCDLRYPWDRILAFDFGKAKRNDYLFIWTSILGRCAVLKNDNGNFVPIFKEWCRGIGGYETMKEADYAIALDWTGSGCDDHIFLLNTNYDKKPICAAVTHQGNQFVAVWKSNDPVGGWPKTPIYAQEVFSFAFDYESSGKNNYLGMYRSGHGQIWLMHSPKHDGHWQTVYRQNENGQGIGNCNLKGGKMDRCIAFDYDGSGKMDHLFVYRRGTGIVSILKKK